MKISLFILISLVKSLICCNIKENELECDDEIISFNSSQVYTAITLSFSNEKEKILDSNLFVSNELKLADNFTLNLKNIRGFGMINPFSERKINNGSLFLDDSAFNFYSNENLIDESLCQEISDNEIFVSAFDVFSHMVSLGSNNIYSNKTCPIHFKNSNINTFRLNDLNQATEQLRFVQLNNTQLNCTIKNVEIFDSVSLNLNNQLFDMNLFSRINSLLVDNSILNDIQDDLFSDFNELKSIELKLNNFKDFVEQSSMKWLNSLNTNVTTDSNNTDDQRQMFITLTDLISTYEYPDDDLCKFKDFPHERLVFPVINTKPNLNCTCTLIWLIQYKDRVSGGPQRLETSSTKNCLNNPDFNSKVLDCNFPNRLTECDFAPTNDKCKFKKNSISCSNFSTFSELNFSGISASFQSVSIEPSQPILLDTNLDFMEISFTNSFDAKFSNIKGFNLVSENC